LQLIEPALQPIIQLHAVHRQAVALLFLAGKPSFIASGKESVPSILLLPKVDGRLDLLRVKLHPLAANLHQRRFEGDQGVKLLAGQLGVA
jgi:hypothetical protein